MNGNFSMEAHQGVVPLTIRMTNELKVEGNQIQYESINLTMISIIGRFYKVSKEQNQIRYSIVLNDDSGILKASYFSKRNDDDPIKNMLDNELDDMNYYEFILQVKVFKDAPYFIIQNFIQTSVNVWMFHTMKIIQLEQVSRPKIDWNELKKQPLDIQIEGYIRYYKKVNISQLLKQFNCSLQQLKVHIEQLKKRSAIAECINKETFRIFN